MDGSVALESQLRESTILDEAYLPRYTVLLVADQKYLHCIALLPFSLEKEEMAFLFMAGGLNSPEPGLYDSRLVAVLSHCLFSLSQKANCQLHIAIDLPESSNRLLTRETEFRDLCH